jgi:probable rRNA maturation factor
MIYVQIADDFTGQVRPDSLELAAIAALRSQPEQAGGDLSVVIEDDAHLQELNHTFLGIDASTDVLSFPSGEAQPDPETGRVYLGDVIISFPRATEQAAAAGHAVEDELRLLVVHGVLHLLGHDHAADEEKARMWSVQAEVLQELNVRLNRLPE